MNKSTCEKKEELETAIAQGEKMNFQFTHARHDPAHCLAPGLFRSLRKGERKKSNLDITYPYGKDTSIRFVGFQPLGVDDMRLLQTLVAMGGPSDLMMNLSDPTLDGKAKMLTELLDPQHEAKKENSIVVRTTLYNLIKEMGYAKGGGNKRQQVIESLRRLSNITLFVRNKNKECSTHLLSFALDENDGKLYVANNHRITNAILGDHTQHTYISLIESRALKSDPAYLLHQRLCAVIDPGTKRPIKLETLIQYVWFIENKVSHNRARKQKIIKALGELQATGGWEAKETSKDLFEVKRSSIIGHL